MNRLTALLLLPALLLVSCAPTAKRVATDYDAGGSPTRQVEEEVHVGKYSVYGPAITGVVAKLEEGKKATLATIERQAAPLPGESRDLTAYKAGQAAGLTAVIAATDYSRVIEAIHYGQDEYDVQAKAVDAGAGILKTFAFVGGAWKVLDTALEQAGDVAVGEGATYAPKEVHLTGNDLGDGNSIDISSDSPPSTITETVTNLPTVTPEIPNETPGEVPGVSPGENPEPLIGE